MARQYDKGHEGVRKIYDKCSILKDYLEKHHKRIASTSPKVTAINFDVVYRFFLPHLLDRMLYQQRNISKVGENDTKP